MDPITTGLAVFGSDVLTGAGSELGRYIVEGINRPKDNDVDVFFKRYIEGGGEPEITLDRVGNVTIIAALQQSCLEHASPQTRLPRPLVLGSMSH